MSHPIRCAQCDKAMRAEGVEVIFWKPTDRPYGLHRRCERPYQEGETNAAAKLERRDGH